MQEYEALSVKNRCEMSQVRGRGAIEENQEGTYLLRVRAQPGLRFHDLAEAFEYPMPEMRRLHARKGKPSGMRGQGMRLYHAKAEERGLRC